MQIQLLLLFALLSVGLFRVQGQCPGPLPTAPSNLSDLQDEVPTSGRFYGWSWTAGSVLGHVLLIEGMPSATQVCEIQDVNNGSHVVINHQIFRVIKRIKEARTAEISYTGLKSCTPHALVYRNITWSPTDVPPWRIVRFRTRGCQNSLPTVSATNPSPVAEGGTASALVQADDEDIPFQTLKFSLDAPFPVGMDIKPTGLRQARIIWPTSKTTGSGSYPVTVRVTDSAGIPGTKTASLVFTVLEVNQPPVIVPIPDVTIPEMEPWSFTVTATDPDLPKNTLAYELEQPPADMTIDRATGQISWTPSEAQGPGSYVVVVKVSDQSSGPLAPSLTTTVSFKVTVLEMNGGVETFMLAIGQEVGLGVIGGTNAPGAGSISHKGDVDEYLFEAVEGQRLYVDEIRGDSSLLTWECLIPETGSLWEKQPLGTWNGVADVPDVGIVTVPRTGTYRIVVRGMGEYGFKIVESPVHKAFRIRMTDKITPGKVNGLPEVDGELVPEWVGRLTIAGELGVYEFDGLKGRVIHFDYLQADEGWLVWWRITTPSGTHLWDTPLAFSKGSLPPYQLPEDGTYTIQVYGYGGYVGNYGFQIKDQTPGIEGPVRLRIRLSDTGSVWIEMDGQFNPGTQIEQSEDLVHWEPLTDRVNPVSDDVGRVEISPRRGYLFYRARVGP